MQMQPTVAIMQPYLFPYIGYFQMVNAVDIFVFYNDVNYIKRGWINRNRILVNGNEYLFTVPVEDASQNRRICDTRIFQDPMLYKKLLNTIQASYKRAPYFSEIMPLIYSVFDPLPEYIDQLAEKSIRVFCEHFGFSTLLKQSKGVYHNDELKKADRLISICRKEHSNTYINASGGTEIYSKDYFMQHGISLSFIESNRIQYAQFANDFVPNLSIIDVAMFNDLNSIQRFMKDYQLL